MIASLSFEHLGQDVGGETVHQADGKSGPGVGHEGPRDHSLVDGCHPAGVGVSGVLDEHHLAVQILRGVF